MQSIRPHTGSEQTVTSQIAASHLILNSMYRLKQIKKKPNPVNYS